MSIISGRSFHSVGSTNEDLILKTRGLVKIQQGNRAFNIIKDGKLIGIERKIVSEYENKDSINLDKDGLAFTSDDSSFYLVYNGQIYDLISTEGTYVSFLQEQDTTDQQKIIAQHNIGLYFDSKEDALEAYKENKIKDGVIVNIKEQGSFILLNGSLNTFYLTEKGGTITGGLVVTNGISITNGSLQIGNTTYGQTGISNTNLFTIGRLQFSNNEISSQDGVLINNLIVNNINNEDSLFYVITTNDQSTVKSTINKSDVSLIKISEQKTNIVSNYSEITDSEIVDISEDDTPNYVVDLYCDGLMFRSESQVGVLYLFNPVVDDYEDSYDHYYQLFTKAYPNINEFSLEFNSISRDNFQSVIDKYNSSHTQQIDGVLISEEQFNLLSEEIQSDIISALTNAVNQLEYDSPFLLLYITEVGEDSIRCTPVNFTFLGLLGEDFESSTFFTDKTVHDLNQCVVISRYGIKTNILNADNIYTKEEVNELIGGGEDYQRQIDEIRLLAYAGL